MTTASPLAGTSVPAVHARRPVLPLRDIILGGQDGLVNVLGLSLGMSAATGDARVVVTAGLAAMLAESIAMAGVAYTAAGAERERIRLVESAVLASVRERADARHHTAAARAQEAGADPSVIRATLEEEATALEEEVAGVRRELAPLSETHPAAAAAVVGFSTVGGSAVPLVPFLVLGMPTAPWAALVLACCALVVVGAYRARISGIGAVKAATQMAVIGLVSALAGYGIGALLRAPHA